MARMSIAAFALLGALSALPAMAQQPQRPPNPVVNVEWVNPEHFSDLGDARTRKAYVQELDQHIIAYARKVLMGIYQYGDYQLKVSITDVDMAGEIEPSRPGVRVMRDIYPPQIDLTFRLTEPDGTVVNEGKRQLRDLLFQTRKLDRADPLRYEKALIDSWIDRDMKKQS